MTFQDYDHAKKCFAENRNLIDSQARPVEWNLNSGLLSLSGAVEQDLSEIKMLLKKILQANARRS